MGFQINTNTSANFANLYGRITQNKIDSSLEKLSTGLRINSAADDAAGMAIANQLRSQHQGLAQASRNAQDGIGLTKIADAAMEEYTNILMDVRDKMSQAVGDTNSTEARAALQADIDSLIAQAEDIATLTSYNGINLMDGTFTNKKIQTGAYSGQTTDISIGDTKTLTLGISSLDTTTGLTATAGLIAVDAAIKALDTIRSGVGATTSALESRVRVNDTTAVNIKAAESSIRDVDYAAEQERLNTNNIKMQANIFALGKSFENQSLVLNLLR